MQNDGSVAIQRTFGLATIRLDPKTQPMLIETRALGISNSPLGFNVGYAAQNLAMLPRDCRVVLWVDQGTDLKALESRLDSLDGVCSVIAKPNEDIPQRRGKDNEESH